MSVKDEVVRGVPGYRITTSTQYETIDEAIVAAMAELDPGGHVVVHDYDCKSEDGEDGLCTCDPMVLVVGAEA